MPIPQNGQTFSNNLWAVADKLLAFVGSFCGICAQALTVGQEREKSQKCEYLDN